VRSPNISLWHILSGFLCEHVSKTGVLIPSWKPGFLHFCFLERWLTTWLCEGFHDDSDFKNGQTFHEDREAPADAATSIALVCFIDEGQANSALMATFGAVGGDVSDFRSIGHRYRSTNSTERKNARRR
jgi:hypothetical protein